jgi:hypothetical protein
MQLTSDSQRLNENFTINQLSLVYLQEGGSGEQSTNICNKKCLYNVYVYIFLCNTKWVVMSKTM